VRDVINDRLTPKTWALLKGSLLLPLNKKKGGIRPVTQKETLLQVASRYALSLCGPVFGPGSGQLGSGQRGGAIEAAHVLQACSDGCDDSVVIMLDAANAFNEMSRQVMLEEANKNVAFAPALRLLHAVYDVPSPLLVFDEENQLTSTMQSVRGSNQGCVLGSMAFAIGLEATLNQSVDGLRVAHVAYLDNVMAVIRDVDTARQWLQRMQTGLQNIGLRLNMGESQILWPRDSAAPEHWVTLANETAMQLLTGTGQSVGVFIGSQEDVMRQRVTESMQRSTQTLSEFIKMSTISDRNADRLIREVLLQRPQFHMASMPPDVTRDALSSNDEKLLQLFVDKHKLPREVLLKADVVFQLRMPVREGGMGLRQLAQLADGAYLSSLYSASPRIRRAAQKIGADICPGPALLNLLDNPARDPDSALVASELLPSFLRHAYHAVQRLHTVLGPQGKAVVPTMAKLMQDPSPTSRQHALTQAVELATSAPQLIQLKKQQRFSLRMQGSSSKSARKFWSAGSDLRDTVLSNTQYQQALRHKLDLPPSDSLQGLVCSCKPDAAALLTSDPGHHHLCCKAKRLTVTDRHDLVEVQLMHAIRAAGGQARRQIGSDDGKVPDIVLSGLPFMERDTALDVTVTHSLQHANLKLRNPDVKSWLLSRQNWKRDKYDASSAAMYQTFIPFAMDSYGFLAPEAVQFLKKLSQAAMAMHGIAEREFLTRWQRRIVRAVYVGNARVAFECIRHYHRPAGGGLLRR
jgi:hypothetical protein